MTRPPFKTEQTESDLGKEGLEAGKSSRYYEISQGLSG